jgi:hypothetical protein
MVSSFVTDPRPSPTHLVFGLLLGLLLRFVDLAGKHSLIEILEVLLQYLVEPELVEFLVDHDPAALNV